MSVRLVTVKEPARSRTERVREQPSSPERAGRVVRLQLLPVLPEPPGFRAPRRAQLLDQAPERSRVVAPAEVAELVRDDVVEHVGRGDDEPPREGEVAAGGARAPARALVAD